MSVHLRTLGSLAVYVDGVEHPEMRNRPVRVALLLHLALERDTTRDRLMALLWPKSDQDHARQALRQTLYALRQDLGNGWLDARGDTVRATSALTADANDVVQASESGDFARVAQCYDGDFLDGFHLVASQPFQLWGDQWRGRLERLNRQARRALVDEEAAKGNLEEALGEARRWLGLDPQEDEAQHRVLELLARLGRRDEALREYEAFSALLAREGLEPLEETRDLAEAIRSSGATVPAFEAWSASAGGPDSEDEDQEPREEAPPAGASEPVVREGGARDSGNHRGLRPLLLPVAVVAALVLGWGAARLLGRGTGAAGAAVQPERVMVLPLTNETGDSTMDGIGLLAAEWVTYGVSRVGSLTAVPSLDVLQMLEAGLSGESAARRRRAGTLISGRLFRVGDSLELHVRITDLERGAIWDALDPVRIAPDAPEKGLGELRDRIAGSLAVRFVPGTALPDPSVLTPPSYPAFQAVLDATAFVARGDWAGALPHVRRAARLDPDFYRAHLFVAAALSNLGRYAEADSVLDALAPSRDRFSDYERLVFQAGRAELRGDLEGSLAAVRQAVRLDPGGTLHYISAPVALAVGRPREALELYGGLDPHCPWAPSLMGPWAAVTGAHHLLGQHREELKQAHRARALHPDRLEALFFELRALVASGRLDGVAEDVRVARSLAPEPGWTVGSLLYRTAAELRAHGYVEDAAQALDSAVVWYQARPPEENQAVSDRMAYADALLMAGRLAEAKVALEQLSEGGNGDDDVALLGRKGVLAARLGDEAGVGAAEAHLDASRRPYQFGAVDYWLAAIAAWSGEEERAFAFLRRSFTEGQARGIVLHADPYLEPLWSLPAFSVAVAEER